MGFLENKYSFKLVSKGNFSNPKKTIADQVKKADHEINDSNKRSFLKILGVAGVGIAASQLIPSKAEALIMGGTPSTSVLGVRNSSNTRINPATEETLATRATEATLQNVATEATLSTRASESTLAAIKTNSDKFIFDIDGNLLTASSGGASQVSLKNTDNAQINPATDDSVILLRRILKQVDSLGVVDSAQRQKITLDSISGSLTLGTVTTVGTVTTLTSATNLVAIGGVDGRFLYIDTARNAYANGIRSNLIYT